MIYFTSDLHFHHKNIITHCHREFNNAQIMNEGLIRNWNKKISPADEVYILGDITMKGVSSAIKSLTQLNGRKYLIKGNHDQFVDKKDFDRSIFEWIKDYYELKYKLNTFVLFHYPINSWNKQHHGSIHLHGHQHNRPIYNAQNSEIGLKRYDVGVDANYLFPISIEDIITFFEA